MKVALLQMIARVGLILALDPSWALAQPWPQRPITIVIPYAAGGNTDQIARLTATHLSHGLSTTVVVDNRPGASGLLAAKFVAIAKPDGHTLFMGTMSQMVTAPFINTSVVFDPVKDFAPIINIS